MLEKFKKLLALTKRRKFVLTSIILSVGLWFAQGLENYYHYGAILILTALTILLTIWSLKEDLRKITWLMALILPAYFTASVNMFYFLLPERFLVRVGLVILFGIGMYALLLTENIFIVASMRTIQLLRAAHALGFVLTLLIAFLIFDAIFSFRFAPWINVVLIFVSSFALVLQGVWSAKLEDILSKNVLYFSLALTWALAQIAFFISMWPVTIVIASLFLVTSLYVGLGIIQQALVGRLFKQTAFEYLRVGFIVLLIVFFAARWRG